VRFRVEQCWAAPLPTVEAALVDPAFLASLGRLPHLGHPELLDQREDGHVLHQRVRYAFTGELSPAVTRVIDPTKLTWVEVSSLDRRAHVTTFEIVPDHYRNRLTCQGTFRLEDGDGHTTRRTAEGDLSVHFPLVGRRVEQAIVAGLYDHARAEAEALAAWLPPHPAPEVKD
jgi:hypothetical protein